MHEIVDYINACFTGIWVQTHEPDEAEREILALAKEQSWTVACWDVAGGLRVPGSRSPRADGGGDPLAALRALPAMATRDGTALLVMHNFHFFLRNPEVVQTTFNLLLEGKTRRLFLVAMAPNATIPAELEKLFVIVDHPLPDWECLRLIANGLIAGDHDQPTFVPEMAGRCPVIDAATGLSRYEAEGAFALSLAKYGEFRPEVIWGLKAQALKKTNFASLHRGEEKFTSLGGLSALKEFCQRALRPTAPVKPRGVLLLGVSGTGKSAFAKALGAEVGRPTMILDVGALYGSLVGQSEGAVRQALRIADAMAPCILFVDELEKALAGVGGQGDSGVATRLFGTLLTWLSDHTSDVFFVGTSNNITALPPEFSRAERFDGVFFLDLPTVQERTLIWSQYVKHYNLWGDRANTQGLNSEGWTGAEIRSCCRLAAMLDLTVQVAASNVVPVSITAGEQVERLRSWATGRCLNASAPGLYQRAAPPAETRSPAARKIRRNPESN